MEGAHGRSPKTRTCRDERPGNAEHVTPVWSLLPNPCPQAPDKSGTWLPTSLPAPFLAGPVALHGPKDEHSTSFQDQRCKPSARLLVDGLGSRGWRFYPHGMSCLSAWMQQPQSLEFEDWGVHLGDFWLNGKLDYVNVGFTCLRGNAWQVARLCKTYNYHFNLQHDMFRHCS